MRNVLAVITALMVAAVVLAPSLGYSIPPESKVNYTINSVKVNYTIGSGTPAHEMVYSEEMGEHYPSYSITSTPMPYSLKAGTGAESHYSVKLLSNATEVKTLGGYKSPAFSFGYSGGRIGTGLILQKEPENKGEQATGSAPAEPVVTNITSGNVTTNETNVTAPAANITTPVMPENVTIPEIVTGNNTTTTAPK